MVIESEKKLVRLTKPAQLTRDIIRLTPLPIIWLAPHTYIIFSATNTKKEKKRYRTISGSLILSKIVEISGLQGLELICESESVDENYL